MAARRWLITGVSGGFGRMLAEAALAQGDHVAGTLRKEGQFADFEALAPGRAHAVKLDVTDREEIKTAVGQAAEKLGGGIDIVVNNAGFGMMGALEELDADQIDDVIEANLMGTIFVTRAALPYLRESKGVLVNFSSYAGYFGMPGVSTYCAAKFAVEGLSESLHIELGAFGIRVMLVEPGFFKTNFAGGSLKIARHPMAIYDGTPAGAARSVSERKIVQKPAEPELLVDTVMKALDSETVPFRLIIGTDAVANMKRKVSSLQEAVNECEALPANQG